MLLALFIRPSLQFDELPNQELPLLDGIHDDELELIDGNQLDELEGSQLEELDGSQFDDE
jgi:hypothetical protein